MAEVPSGIEAAAPTIDADGNCTHHPIIKLKRYNKSTQQWKIILKTCPLCSVRGTTPPRRGERRRRRDMLGSTVVSDTDISSCSDKEKDTRRPTIIDHNSSSTSANSITSTINSDASPPTIDKKVNQDEPNLIHNSPEDEYDSLSPLESELSLCKQTSNLSVTDTCDITEASTCSGSTTSFHGSSSSSMGIWRYDSIESSGSGSSYRSAGNEGKDLQQQIISPLGMPSSNVVCQPCNNIPPPPIAPPKIDSSRRGRVRAANNSMHSNPSPPPPPRRTARNSYRRSSTGTTSFSQNPRGSISTDTPPLSPRRSSYPSQLCQSTLKGGGEVVVCGMSYTNPITNQRGYYTGQVCCMGGKQVPHGIGTLKYTNFNLGKAEGQWVDGTLVDSVEQGCEGIRRPVPPPPPPRSRGAPPSAHSTQELNMSSLTASSSSGMNDDSSWCQPCDDSSSSAPPSPQSYSPRRSHNGSQELQFCSPCGPSPKVEQTVPQDRGGKPRVSLSPRVEVALPLHFKQKKKSQDLSCSFLTQEQAEYDDVGASSSEESDNSLRTYQTRSSRGSRRSSYPLSPDASYRSVKSTGTSRSNNSKRSLRSYSARESKGAIDIIRTMQF